MIDERPQFPQFRTRMAFPCSSLLLHVQLRTERQRLFFRSLPSIFPSFQGYSKPHRPHRSHRSIVKTK